MSISRFQCQPSSIPQKWFPNFWVRGYYVNTVVLDQVKAPIITVHGISIAQLNLMKGRV